MNNNFLKINKNKQIFNFQNVLYFLIAIIGTFLIVPKYFDGYISPLPVISKDNLWQSLDSSWVITLNYANFKNLTWGKDFIFTYGPLGFLSTRVGWGVNVFNFLLFDVLLFFNFFYIYFQSMKVSKNKLLTIILVLFNFILIPVLIGPGYSHLLLAFLVFWVLRNIENSKHINFCIQVIIFTIIFYVKFNTAIIAAPIYYLGIIYLFIEKKETKRNLFFYSVLPLILIIILSLILNVNLYSYITTAFEIISGYNDIMYLEHNFINKMTALIIIILTTIIFVFNYVAFKGNKLKQIIKFIIFIIPVFVLYKSGFVRGLETDFFIYSTFYFIVNPEIHANKFKFLNSSLLLVCLGLIFYQCYFVNNLKFDFKDKTDKYYLIGLKSFTPTSSFKLVPNNNQLPIEVKNIIGQSKVDVFPWNSQMAFENELNFYNRPVFQSYTSFTEKLEKLNFEHYNNTNTAPNFVLFDYASLDYRYPMFDEPLVNIALLKNYSPAKKFEFQGRQMLLLKKNDVFRKIKLIENKQYAMFLDSNITPKKDIFYKIEIYNSWKGKLYSIFKHAPEIQLHIDSNQPRDYHIGSKLLSTGIFGNLHISTTEDFLKLYNMKESESLSTIKKYNINFIDKANFKDKIKITEYKVTQ